MKNAKKVMSKKQQQLQERAEELSDLGRKNIRKMTVILQNNVSLSRGDLLPMVAHTLTRDQVEQLLECRKGDCERMRMLIPIMSRKPKVFDAFRKGLRRNGYENVEDLFRRLDCGETLDMEAERLRLERGDDEEEEQTAQPKETVPSKSKKEAGRPPLKRTRAAVMKEAATTPPLFKSSTTGLLERHCSTCPYEANMLWIESLGIEGVIINKISDDGRRGQVVVPAQAWNVLSHLQDDIAQGLAEKLEGSWSLVSYGNNTELKCTVGPYQGYHLVNIRIFHNGQATKQGVSFGAVAFQYLQTFFTESPEMKLALDVYKTCLRDRAEEIFREQCVGCGITNPVSNARHTCNNQPTRENVQDILSSSPGIDRFVFQVRLGAQSMLEKIQLEKPGLAYRLCVGPYKQKLQEAVLSLY